MIASNGDPRDPSSLHFINYQNPYSNPYNGAIASIGQVLTFFSNNQLFATYGFGGKAANGPANHCFALNGNDAYPFVQGIQGIHQAYDMALKNIQLSGKFETLSSVH